MVPTERTVNRMIRQTANLITGSGIAAALLLLFATPLTGAFYALYLWCGVSDMVDGTIARRTHSESRLGERLDSAADALFLAVCVIRLAPEIRFPVWMWVWISLIAVGKAVPLLWCAVRGKPQPVPHTILNKITGFLIFLIPLVMRTVPVIVPASIAAASATAAAIQDAVVLGTRHKEG